jgi:hypothetical protein
MLIQIHKIHHNLDLGENTTFLFIIYSTTLGRGYIKMVIKFLDTFKGLKGESQNDQIMNLTTFGVYNFLISPPNL